MMEVISSKRILPNHMVETYELTFVPLASNY